MIHSHAAKKGEHLAGTRQVFRLMAAVFLTMLLAACTQSSVEPDLTPSTAEPNGEATVPVPQSDDIDGWKTIEVPGWNSQPGFSLKLPQSWELGERRGIDSYVGDLVGDDAELHFDYGSFGWGLNPKDDPEHEYNVTYETIGGVEAKFLWPKNSSEGFTGVYYSDLGGPGLGILGEELTQEQQHTAFAIFRSVRSLD